MNLEQFSKKANQDLSSFTNSLLSNVEEELRENVLYAISIASPLRERTYLMFLSACLCDIEWARIKPFSYVAEYLIVSQLSMDDIIDSANIRSHKPSLISKTNNAKAILVSQYLNSLGFSTILTHCQNLVSNFYSAIFNEFNEISNTFFQYQYLCSALENNPTISLELVDKLAYGRTGRLIEACFAIPIVLSGKNELESPLRECGKWIGIAIQHRDDILDFISDPEILGKPIFLDYINGQPNLVLSLFNMVKKNENIITRLNFLLQEAKNSFSNKVEINPDTTQEILEIIKKSNAFELARNKVTEYCFFAEKSLYSIHRSSYKDELINLIHTIASIEFPWENN